MSYCATDLSLHSQWLRWWLEQRQAITCIYVDLWSITYLRTDIKKHFLQKCSWHWLWKCIFQNYIPKRIKGIFLSDQRFNPEFSVNFSPPSPTRMPCDEPLLGIANTHQVHRQSVSSWHSTHGRPPNPGTMFSLRKGCAVAPAAGC